MNGKKDLVNRYLQYYRDLASSNTRGDDSAIWEVEGLLKNREDGLKIVSELVEAAEPELIGIIAAGPLENLLDMHREAIKSELEVLVRKSPKMRKAIQGVWASGKTREVLDQILDKFNLTYGSP
jgi:hypothetical protein